MARLLLKVYPRNIKIRNNATVLHWWLKKYSTCNVPTQCDSTYLGLVESKEYLRRKKYSLRSLGTGVRAHVETLQCRRNYATPPTFKSSQSCVKKPFVIRLAQHKTHAQHLTHVQHPVYGPFGNVVMHLNIELCWRSLTLST